MEAFASPVVDGGGLNVLPARNLPQGTRLGKFEVQQLIGRGGMGAVYRAWDAQLHRNVAIKTLAPVDEGAGQSELLKTRFQREAMAVGKVKHQNVVQVYDVGFAEDGTPFIVMEYLEGRNLGDLLKSRPSGLSVAEAVEIMLGVCAGVAACHRQGIIHRDLKPANVFLAKTDFQDTSEVKVLDFGVSKAVKEEELTYDGQIVGTPNYMSPEQARGKSEAAIDARADQYAIGVLLYACVARRLPYQDLRHLELLEAIARGEFKPPSEFRPEIAPELEAIILRAMNVDPELRFPGVHELGRALLPFATERGQQKWTWMFSSVPNVPDVASAASAASTAHAASEVSSVVSLLASTPSRAPTVAERNQVDRPKKPATGAEAITVVPAPADAVPPEKDDGVVIEAAPAMDSHSAITATKVQSPPPPSPWSVAGEPAAAGAAVPPTVEKVQAAVSPAPAPATTPARRGRSVATAAAIAVVAASVAFVVFRPRAEEPLGVRNIPPGSPVLAAPMPPQQPPPAAAGSLGASQGATAAQPTATATRGAESEAEGTAREDGPSHGAKEGKAPGKTKAMEARRRKLPKVEVGTNGVPIPP